MIPETAASETEAVPPTKTNLPPNAGSRNAFNLEAQLPKLKHQPTSQNFITYAQHPRTGKIMLPFRASTSCFVDHITGFLPKKNQAKTRREENKNNQPCCRNEKPPKKPSKKPHNHRGQHTDINCTLGRIVKITK